MALYLEEIWRVIERAYDESRPTPPGGHGEAECYHALWRQCHEIPQRRPTDVLSATLLSPMIQEFLRDCACGRSGRLVDLPPVALFFIYQGVLGGMAQAPLHSALEAKGFSGDKGRYFESLFGSASSSAPPLRPLYYRGTSTGSPFAPKERAWAQPLVTLHRDLGPLFTYRVRYSEVEEGQSFEIPPPETFYHAASDENPIVLLFSAVTGHTPSSVRLQVASAHFDQVWGALQQQFDQETRLRKRVRHRHPGKDKP